MFSVKYLVILTGLILLDFIFCLFFLFFYRWKALIGLDFGLVLLLAAMVLLLFDFAAAEVLALIFSRQKNREESGTRLKRELKSCQRELSDSHHLVGAGQISLGLYHDLANILTASNLVLHEIFMKSKDSAVNQLTRKAFFINKQASSLIVSFKKQCRKNDDKISFSLVAEIRRILDIFNFNFVKDKVKIELKYLQDSRIFGDPVKFGRVITNLISNSLESFNRSRERREIKIKVWEKKEEVKIFFSDSGPGIKLENLSAWNRPTRDYRHCSLGLALIKKIIEQDFLGRVELSSQPDRGTEFIITLPRV